MKKLFLAVFVGSTLLFNAASAQKTGYVNMNDLLLLMPERKKAENDIQEYAKQLDNQLKTISAEYEAKVGDYQKQEPLMSDIVKSDKQKELADLEERIRNFQQKAQEDLQKKQSELLEPMMKKAKKAIEEVSKENGYKQVFDTSSGIVIYNDPADDIISLVKKKIGVGVDAPAAPATPAPAPKGK